MGERGSYAPKQAAIISIQSILPGIAFTYFSSRFIKVKKQLHNRLALNKFQKYANCLKWDKMHEVDSVIAREDNCSGMHWDKCRDLL